MEAVEGGLDATSQFPLLLGGRMLHQHGGDAGQIAVPLLDQPQVSGSGDPPDRGHRVGGDLAGGVRLGHRRQLLHGTAVAHGLRGGSGRQSGVTPQPGLRRGHPIAGERPPVLRHTHGAGQLRGHRVHRLDQIAGAVEQRRAGHRPQLVIGQRFHDTSSTSNACTENTGARLSQPAEFPGLPLAHRSDRRLDAGTSEGDAPAVLLRRRGHPVLVPHGAVPRVGRGHAGTSPWACASRGTESGSTSGRWTCSCRGRVGGGDTYHRSVIDLRLVREHPDVVRASQRARGADECLVDQLLAADETRREAVGRADTLRGEQKAASQAVAKAAREERPAVLERAKALAAEVKEAEEAQRAADAALREAHLALPNVVHDGVPPGGEDDAVPLRTVGEVPSYDFPVKDHLEIGEALGAIDMERGAKVSGARFYFLTGPGALLEFALAQLAISRAVVAGFTPVVAPALVKPEAMEGTGFLGAHAEEVYRVERDNLYLVGTSEVALAGMHAGEVLDLDGPRRYAGWSSCFRREAGSYGKDTRGIIRVHWFDKVEMFSFCRPEEAADEHRRLLAWEEEFLQQLELPYRVVDIAAGDLGNSAARKFDIEAWFPSQGTYRELTSTS